MNRTPRRLAISLVVVLLASLGAAPLAIAAPGQPVAFEAIESAGVITYNASSPLCPTGSAVRDNVTGHQSPSGTRLTYDLVVTCADGSGSFTVRVRAKIDAGLTAATGTWRIAAGTLEWSTLRGGGDMAAVLTSDSAMEYFAGRVSP